MVRNSIGDVSAIPVTVGERTFEFRLFTRRAPRAVFNKRDPLGGHEKPTLFSNNLVARDVDIQKAGQEREGPVRLSLGTWNSCLSCHKL